MSCFPQLLAPTLISLLIPTLLLPACTDAENDEYPDYTLEDDSDEQESPPANWNQISSSTAPTLLEVYANGSDSGSGCDSWGERCGSCWLDGAGHGKCTKVRLPMSTDSYDYAECMTFN